VTLLIDRIPLALGQLNLSFPLRYLWGGYYYLTPTNSELVKGIQTAREVVLSNCVHTTPISRS